MECYFCKRDEKEINKIFYSLIESLDNKILELDNRIKNKKLDYQLENGFTAKKFEKVKNINKNIISMEINYVMDNFEKLQKLEPDLDILQSYLTKYKPEISDKETVKDLVNLYANEPNYERLSPYIEEIIIEKNEILDDIKNIKTKIKFYEIENKNSKIVFEHEEKIIIDIVYKKQYYFEMNKGKSKPEKVFLCPYCSYLFDIIGSVEDIRDEILQKKIKEAEVENTDMNEWDFGR
jgi:hypothetical protein